MTTSEATNIKLTYERDLSIDFVRVCSMFLIICYHVFVRMDYYYPQVKHPLTNFANGDWGEVGVSCFLVISGVVLARKYRAMKTDFKTVLGFYKKRFWSIYPSFYLTWILALALKIKANGIEMGGVHANLLLTLLGFDGYFLYRGQNFYLVGEWFLGAIISLYILFPYINKMVRTHMRVLVIALVLCALFANASFWTMIPFRNIFSVVMPFSIGIILSSKGLVHKGMKRLFIALVFFTILYFIRIPLYENIIVNVMGILMFFILYELGNQLVNGTHVIRIVAFLSFSSYETFLIHNQVNFKIINTVHFPVGVLEQMFYLLVILFLSITIGYFIKICSKNICVKFRKKQGVV